MDDRDDRVNFDKFMDDIVIRERKLRSFDEREETPQRRFMRMHRELPQNRIRYGTGSNG
jgi:hypothetical protein